MNFKYIVNDNVREIFSLNIPTIDVFAYCNSINKVTKTTFKSNQLMDRVLPFLR